MAVPSSTDSLIRTRRFNQTQSFLLEERLKVLDCKKSQKNAEFHVEKYSLQKQMEEIKSVRKNWGISVERRKLLRSQGYTIDARAANRDNTVVIKKYSVPEMTIQRNSSAQNKINHEVIVKRLSQFKIREAGEMTETGCEEPPKMDVRSRSRHQFRVIEPPCRPGSRRNFVQLSHDKLKELKEKEDEESGESLIDSNVKLDHRCKILSPGLVKFLKNNSQSGIDEEGGHPLIVASCVSCEGSVSGKRIKQYPNTTVQVKDYNPRPSSAPQLIPIYTEEKQAYTESRDSDEKVLSTKESRKLISKSYESLDHVTEVCTPDRFSHLNRDIAQAGDQVVISPKDVNHVNVTAVSEVTRSSQSTYEPKRKHASCSNRSPVRLAFVEPQSATSNNDYCTLKKRRSQIEARPAKSSYAENTHFSSGENSQQFSEKTDPFKRATLPSKFFSSVQSQHIAKSHGENYGKEPKRLSVGSRSMNVSRSKITTFSSDPERSRLTDAVTYAYDARPGQSLCKGYVTMQMTVKGKQVKVHIPKFPSDSDSQPVLERARKKVADDRLHSRMLLEKERTEELEKVPETI